MFSYKKLFKLYYFRYLCSHEDRLHLDNDNKQAYSALHSVLNPDIDAMRKETGGTPYADTRAKILDTYSKTDVSKSGFYIDLREFMNSAPGPYSPGYSDRGGINPTWPDQKASNKNLQMDVDIYNYVVNACNLD